MKTSCPVCHRRVEVTVDTSCDPPKFTPNCSHDIRKKSCTICQAPGLADGFHFSCQFEHLEWHRVIVRNCELIEGLINKERELLRIVTVLEKRLKPFEDTPGPEEEKNRILARKNVQLAELIRAIHDGEDSVRELIQEAEFLRRNVPSDVVPKLMSHR